jgi:hypothetical protein
MALQQIVPITITLVGDGTSTAYTYNLSKLPVVAAAGYNRILNLYTLPTSVTYDSVDSSVAGSASIDASGNLVITLNSALANNVSADITVDLFFASGGTGTFVPKVLELKDTGRTIVTLSLDQIAGVTSEALTTMTINKGGTVTTGTSYTVTAGKTFRIQSMFMAMLSGTGTTQARARLRSAASVLATSPIICSLFAGSSSSVGVGTAFMDFPDGLEVAAGQQVGISQLSSSASAVTLTVIVVGYEY